MSKKHEATKYSPQSLHEAVLLQDEARCKLILKDLDFDIDAVNSDGQSALYCAVALDSPRKDMRRITQILLERGADINRVTGNESSPIICAARDGNATMLLLLLNKNTTEPKNGAQLLSEALRVVVRDSRDAITKGQKATPKVDNLLKHLIAMDANIDSTQFSAIPADNEKMKSYLKGLEKLPKESLPDFLPPEVPVSSASMASSKSVKSQSSVCTIS